MEVSLIEELTAPQCGCVLLSARSKLLRLRLITQEHEYQEMGGFLGAFREAACQREQDTKQEK